MKHLTIILMAIMLSVGAVQARDSDNNGYDMNNRLAIDFTLYDGYYSMGLGYHRMVCPWFGFGGSIGYWTVVGNGGLISDIFDSPWDYDYPYYDYDYDDRDYDEVQLYVEPSLVLRTPTLFRLGRCRFNLTAVPAVRLSANYTVGTYYQRGDTWESLEYRCDNITYSLSTMLTLRLEMLEFSLGYNISSLDITREYSSAKSYTRSPSHAITFSFSGYF